MRILRLTSLVIASLLALPMFALAQPKLTNLGTLGGDSYAYGINDAGVVVGQSNGEGAIFQHGGITAIPNTYTANAINNNGQIVGSASFAKYPGQERAFLHSKGKLIDLGTLGGNYSQAWAVNSQGDVVGESYLADNSTTHAFLYTKGKIYDLGTLGGSNSYAYGINDSGIIVGTSDTFGNDYTSAFIVDSTGFMQDLAQSSDDAEANAINNKNHVAGAYDDKDGYYNACIFENSLISDLGRFPNGGDSYAYALNEHDVVVGEAYLPSSSYYHAFVYTGGSLFDLGTLGGHDSVAYAINTKGVVVGSAQVADGTWRAFLYKP